MTLARLRTVLRHLRDRPPDGPGSDADLTGRYAATRDPDAFAELVRRHGRLVWGVCRRATRSSADADDAYQATWLVFARNPAAVRTPGAIGGWLHGVAVRVARRVTAKHSAADLTHLPDRATAIGEAAGVREYLAALDEELARLPDRLRLPLVLCFLEEETQDEAAKRLGLSLSTLKRRLDAGKGLLRSRLAGRGVDLSAALAGAGLAAVGPPTLAGAAGGVAVQVSREVLFAMWTTKLQTWAAGALVAGGLAAGGGAYVATSYAQAPGKGDGPPAAGKSDDKPGNSSAIADRIREAREAELATLRKQYDLDAEIRKDGTISREEASSFILNVLANIDQLYRAESGLARTPAERVAAARNRVERSRAIEAFFATRANQGLNRQQLALQATAARQAAEAELLRVEAGQAETVATTPRAQPVSDPPAVRELWKKQEQAVERGLMLATARLRTGAISREEAPAAMIEISRWSKRMADLGRVMYDDPLMRLAFARDHYVRMREYELFFRLRAQRGLAVEQVALEALFHRQEAEIELRRAEAAIPPGTKVPPMYPPPPAGYRGTVVEGDGSYTQFKPSERLPVYCGLAVYRPGNPKRLGTLVVLPQAIERPPDAPGFGFFEPAPGVPANEQPKPGDELRPE